MGGVCFAADEDEVRYRRSDAGFAHGAPHPHGYPGHHPPGHPGMRKMPPPHGMVGRGLPPPPHGRHGGGAGRFMDEREFMDQKFRRPLPDVREQQGNPTRLHPTNDASRDIFGGRGMRPDKMREFGAPPSEDSVASGVPYQPQARPQQHAPRSHGERGLPPLQHSPQRLQKSPQHQNKSPQHRSPHRPRKSPSHRPGFENHFPDDHLDHASTAANYHEYISPRTVKPKRDSGDGYDVSPERRNTNTSHEHIENNDQLPRRKSLSERILEYKKRKLTEDMDIANPHSTAGTRTPQRGKPKIDDKGHASEDDSISQPFMPPSGRQSASKSSLNGSRAKTTSKSADRPDNGDEDFGHNEQMKRKKSLQERVAEFKERRKNSQVRFDDESETEASERNNMHRDYFAILDREAAEKNGGARDRTSERDDPRLQSRSSHRGHGFEGRDPRRSHSRKKKSSHDRHERMDTRHGYREEDHTRKEKRRQTRRPNEHYTESPDPRKNSGGFQKRKSFIGKPKKSNGDTTPERAVRRSSRRAPPSDRDMEPNSKKFTFNDDRPPRRMSRRNDHEQHEWAIHE